MNTDQDTTTGRPVTTVHTTLDSPLGDLLVIGHVRDDDTLALASLSMPEQRGAAHPPHDARADAGPFTDLARRLEAYFAGEPDDFADLTYATHGTPFRERVWAALDTIPYGTTTTYGAIAAGLGVEPAGVRAVGTAIGRNPLLVLRPCHRVVGADGALRGYAAGLERKRLLLEREGAWGPAGVSPAFGAVASRGRDAVAPPASPVVTSVAAVPSGRSV